MNKNIQADINEVKAIIDGHKDKNILQRNSGMYYHGINDHNLSKDDNSGDGFNNTQEENEEEQEQEEISIAEIENLKKIKEKTILLSEKYANFYSPKNSDKMTTENNDSSEKINSSTEDINNMSHINLEIYSENDDIHINQKINPNKERIFRNIHCYLYLNNEPLVIIGPDLKYFIWVFTLVSFFSILIYSIKQTSFLYSLIFILGYLFFSICYFLLMVVNPGIPSEKKHYDINDLNFNYRQCKICNCIYHKNDFKYVNHCKECGICIEGSDHHCNFAAKCIGRHNKYIYKIWIASSVFFVFIIFFYLFF